MTEELKKLLQECDTLKARLVALRPLPAEALKKIDEALAVEYTYESNRIEGNTLTLQETELVVNEGVTIAGKSMREHLEAINHREAIDYIKDFAKKRHRDKRGHDQRDTRPCTSRHQSRKCWRLPHGARDDFG